MIRLLSLVPTHAAVAAAVQARCFETAWDASAMAKVLAMPGTFGWLALVRSCCCKGREGEEKLTGLIICRRILDEAEVLMVGVIPEARRLGVGRRLVENALATGATTFLEVAIDNMAALALYRKLGFERAGRRFDYYQRPNGTVADALVLRAGGNDECAYSSHHD